MAKFDIPTLDELHDLLIAGLQNLLPKLNLSRLSDNWKRERINALAVTDGHAHIAQVERDVFPDRAQGEYIARHGYTWDVERRAASKARGTAAGRVRGDVGATWATTDALKHKSGARYQPVSSGTMPAAGFVDVDIISITTGEAANLDAGEFLEWESSPPGLESEVELVVDVEGAEDEEDVGKYQQRIIDRIGEPAKGGTAGDYIEWIREATDANGDPMSIDEGYVWKHRGGYGTTDVAGLFSGTGANRIMTAAQVTALQSYIDAVAPVTHQPRVLSVQLQTQDVEITLTPTSDSKNAKDWDDATPPTVSSWTAATRLLKLSANRPASMGVGDRLVVAGHSGKECIIEAFGSNPDEVILKSPVPYTPVAAETVYSGGPLVELVRAEVQALFDSLGPRFGDFGAHVFESDIKRAHLFKASQTPDGVGNTTVVTPASDVVALEKQYPDDGEINLLVAGEILVRYA